MVDDYWFKFLPTNWLLGTRGRSPAAKGIYIDIIANLRLGKRMPTDPRALAPLLGYRDHRTVARPLAELLKAGKLYDDGTGHLRNPKVDNDLAERAEQRRDAETGRQDRSQTMLHFPPKLVNKV